MSAAKGFQDLFHELYRGAAWGSPPQHWRDGQTVWNIVHSMLPEYAEPLREGPYDPYHNDTAIGKFLIAVGTAYDNAVEGDIIEPKP